MRGKELLEKMDSVNDEYVKAAEAKTGIRKSAWMRIAAAAACLAVVAVSAAALSGRNSDEKINAVNPENDIIASDNKTESGAVPKIEMAAPAADAPEGMRKYINYGGSRYAFLGDGATYNLTAEHLGDSLGVLEYDIQLDPEANGKKDLSATFAIGGTVTEIKSYDPAFRVAVELDGAYYICQKVGNTDGKAMDVSAYFEIAGFGENAEGISIYNHMGTEKLGGISDDITEDFVRGITGAVEAKLTGDQYMEIASAQSNGKSFTVSLELSDGTEYRFYLIPSMDIVMIGDNRYVLPAEFAEKFGSAFEGLVQEPLPAQ